jgi:hypothetical protein
MDLFAITCTTCRSRLRVRDPAAVGQILACPRCGGMVMVKPPPAWQEAGEQKSELPTAADAEGPRVKFDETVHNSAFDVLEDLLSDAPPKVQTPPPSPPAGAAKKASNTPATGSSSGVIPPPAGKPRFVGGPPVKRSATPPPVPAKAGAAPSIVGASDAGPIPPVVRNGGSSNAPPASAKEKSAGAAEKEKTVKEKSATAKPPAPPPPADVSVAVSLSAGTQVAPRRTQWLVVGSIAVGVVLAFAGASAYIHYLRPADVRRPIAPKKNGKAQNTEVATRAKSEVESTEEEKDAGGAISAALPGGNSESPLAAANATAANDATAQSPGAAATTDPLGLVKEAPPAASSPTTAAVTSDPLAKFDRFLDGGTNDPLNKPAARAAATTEPPPQAADSAPARPLAPRPPPRVIDVGKQLAFSLGAMETSGTPLAEFVQLMSELSAIPITLDVPFIPATPESPVAVRLTNTTVGNALTEALKPLRLEYVIENDQLIVRRAEGKLPAMSTVSVKDLTGGDEQAMRELVELLKAVVDPAAWADGDEGGTISVDAAKGSLVITHPRSAKYPIAVRMAIEKLREARTPPLAHELKVDVALFKLDTRSALAKPRLEKPFSLNYSQPTRLITILERLGSAAGVRILVDWRDVASAGWNPAGEATLTVRNEPLSTALDALLTPLDLTWRVIDGQTIQVVTPTRLAEQGELEFYKIDDLLTGGRTAEELIGQLCVALGEGVVMAGGEATSAGGVIGYDDGGKCLLVWLSQPKQREMEALLTKWRAK